MLEPIQIDPRTFLRQHCDLPVLPDVVSQIQKALGESDIDLNKVAEMISSDSGILAQILKVVNSAYYGLPREITKVRIAVSFLGLNEVYRIVLALSVVNTLKITEKKMLDNFWFHSFFAATCTKYLGKKYQPLLSSEELWAPSMLHDIGRLVYMKFFPDHYGALTDLCEKNGCTFSEAESHFSFPSSGYLGTLLCDHWRLPKPVRMACEFHTLKDLLSDREDGSPKPLQQMVCLGNLLAVLSADYLNSDVKEQITDGVTTDLGLNEEEFLALMGDIYELKIEVEGFMAQFS
ncbi:MAG: hypothetical protein BBJ60_07405 [Desulfobacterales bacterium S7086C20]|nr:MAG: hypothetical protein BBJ60_07405 [Desulfobacterales bacterium S7086C20]